jgi:hypothetical protein
VTEEEVYDLMIDLLHDGFPAVKVAFFDENLNDADINHLGKMVANNHGANVRIFESLSNARYWIELKND